jgi:hypothetical protein
MEIPSGVRVQGQIELVLPPELEAGLGQGIVPFMGPRMERVPSRRDILKA